MGMLCGSCKAEMAKVSTLNSGNSTYQTFRCGGCQSERTVCVAIGK